MHYLHPRFRACLLTSTACAAASILLANVAIAAQPAQTAAAAATVEEIVVTGTRIVRDGFQAPTPVTVIGADEINRVAAINLIDVVTKLPTLSQSYNSHTGGQSTSDGNAGTNALSLRGL